MHARQMNLARKLTGTKVALLGDSRAAQSGTAVTPTSITSSGTTCTVSATGHGLLVGQPITVGRCTQTAYNGCFTVAGVTDANTFTYTAKSTPSATPATGSPSYTNPQAMKDTGFFTWINAVMDGRFSLVLNAGVSGDTVAGYSARVGDVIAAQPDYCFVMGIFNSLSTQTAAQIITSLKGIYTQLLNAGINVIALTESPYHSSATGYTTAKHEIILEVNNWMRNYARRYAKGILLLDAYQVVVDPLSATGQPKADMHWTSDSVHWTPKACRAIAAEFKTRFGSMFPYTSTLAMSLIDDYTTNTSNPNILVNGMMAGTGGTLAGGATGSAPDNWTIDNNTASATVGTGGVARSDGIGYDLQMDITFGADGQHARCYTTSSIHSRVSAGDKLYFECEVSWTGATNLEGIWGRVAIATGGITSSNAAMNPQQAGQWDNTDGTIVLRTPTFTVPATAITNLTAWVHFYGGGAGAATVKVGRAVLRKVSE